MCGRVRKGESEAGRLEDRCEQEQIGINHLMLECERI